MKITRQKYISSIQSFLDSSNKSILVLDGPRFAGKSTLLEHVYTSDMRDGKRYYYSFDDNIGTKEFKDSHDFMQYMQIKFGINFQSNGLLLLNEIQYSKNIGKILHNLIKKEKVKIKIIATSISQGEYKEFLQLREEDYDIMTVHTLSFLEFIEFKGFHTEYIDPYNFSEVIAQDILPLLQEFINRGAYPSVVSASSEQEKKLSLQQIMQEIFRKDVTYWFDRNDIGYFENIMHIVNDQHGQIYNKLRIKNTYDIPLGSVDRYMKFLDDNYIITTIKHFFSDKKREVSHKQKALMLDFGIKNYLHNSFVRRMHDEGTMKYMALQEIYKHLGEESKITTYKKINGSEIDFIVQHNNKLYPVVIGARNTASVPKVYEGFLKQYGDNVGALFKTSLSISGKERYKGKDFFTIPYYLIGNAISSIK